MIYVYNETTEAQWHLETEQIKENFSIHTLANKDYPFLCIKVKKGIDANQFVFNEKEDNTKSENVYTLMATPVVLGLDRKNFDPYIAPIRSEKKKDDEIFLATFELNKDDRILNAFVRDGHIINYACDVNGQRFVVIFTLNRHKDKANPRFSLTMRDVNWNFIRKREIIIDMKNGGVKVYNKNMRFESAKNDRFVNLTDNSDKDGTDIVLPTYIPMRPSYNIYVKNQEEKEKVESLISERFHMDTSKDKAVHFIVADEISNLPKVIDSLVRRDVTAMTYFIGDKNADELKANKDEVYDQIRDNAYGKDFVYVLGLSNDGYIIRLKG